MRLAKIASIIALVAAPAFGVITHTEPLNDAIAGADPILFPEFGGPLVRPAADVGLGSLFAGDVDYYSILLNEGDILTAITTPLTSLPLNFSSPDTLLGMFTPGGALLYFNDDAGSDGVGGGAVGPVRGSAIRYLATAPGIYYIAVTGFGNPAFIPGGGGVEVGDYLLTVSVIPEPATIGLLIAGAGLLARRRK